MQINMAETHIMLMSTKELWSIIKFYSLFRRVSKYGDNE